MLQTHTTRRAGFSLVELTIVVVILGVLATFAVPRFMRSVERSKAAEVFNYLQNVYIAQEGYNARNATYSNTLPKLDVAQKAPKYFAVGRIVSVNFQTTWRITARRNARSSGFGRYTVVFDRNGFNQALSTIPAVLIPSK
jgi:prepilin-type N-terminal cleavage/methylation domain-containing protein